MKRVIYDCNRCGAESHEPMKVYYLPDKPGNVLPGNIHLCAACSAEYDTMIAESVARLQEFVGLKPSVEANA